VAKAKSHKLLWVAGAAVGGWAAYEYLYKPWAAQQAALVAAGALPATTGLASLLPAISLPSPLDMVSAPTALPSTTPVPSIGAPVGGVVGACMASKGGTWTQTQCQTRLDALVQAARNAQAAISNLQNTANPAAAGIAASQAALAAEQAALAVATTAYNQLVVAGDVNGAATYHAAILGHQSDINDLTALIAAAQKPVDNSAAIAAYQGQLAANDNDYFNLTGVHLVGGV
jgi:hypothetical protein